MRPSARCKDNQASFSSVGGTWCPVLALGCARLADRPEPASARASDTRQRTTPHHTCWPVVPPAAPSAPWLRLHSGLPLSSQSSHVRPGRAASPKRPRSDRCGRLGEATLPTPASALFADHLTEAREGNEELRGLSGLPLRTLDFGLLSDFGLRTSDFRLRPGCRPLQGDTPDTRRIQSSHVRQGRAVSPKRPRSDRCGRLGEATLPTPASALFADHLTEAREGNEELRGLSGLPLRTLDFGLLSDFGLRISAVASARRPCQLLAHAPPSPPGRHTGAAPNTVFSRSTR